MEVVHMEGSTTSVTVSSRSSTSAGGGASSSGPTTTCNETSTESEGCPTIKVSSSECEDREFETYLEHKRAIIAQKLSALEIRDGTDDDDGILFVDRDNNHHGMDGMEEIEPEIEKCHDELECKGQTINDNDVECYGKSSCQQATIEQTAADGMIRGYGESAIENGYINTRNTAECNGKDSCATATYFDAKSALCSGYESCGYIEADMNVGGIDCIGTRSCSNNIINVVNNIKCNANRACYQSQITAGMDVHVYTHKNVIYTICFWF